MRALRMSRRLSREVVNRAAMWFREVESVFGIGSTEFRRCQYLNTCTDTVKDASAFDQESHCKTHIFNVERLVL